MLTHPYSWTSSCSCDYDKAHLLWLPHADIGPLALREEDERECVDLLVALIAALIYRDSLYLVSHVDSLRPPWTGSHPGSSVYGISSNCGYNPSLWGSSTAQGDGTPRLLLWRVVDTLGLP